MGVVVCQHEDLELNQHTRQGARAPLGCGSTSSSPGAPTRSPTTTHHQSNFCYRPSNMLYQIHSCSMTNCSFTCGSLAT
jgi:hypothetical protein